MHVSCSSASSFWAESRALLKLGWQLGSEVVFPGLLDLSSSRVLSVRSLELPFKQALSKSISILHNLVSVNFLTQKSLLEDCLLRSFSLWNSPHIDCISDLHEVSRRSIRVGATDRQERAQAQRDRPAQVLARRPTPQRTATQPRPTACCMSAHVRIPTPQHLSAPCSCVPHNGGWRHRLRAAWTQVPSDCTTYETSDATCYWASLNLSFLLYEPSNKHLQFL